MKTHRLWDIFCTVIDNHGDLGVCWRLTRQLLAQGQSVRLWVDDASALIWMAPDAPTLPKLQVLPWAAASQSGVLKSLKPADVWIEAFGCTLPEDFVAHGVATHPQQPAWINLEYLSAEDWVPRMHGLPSPVMSGPAKGWTKRFFYPGFTADTGGLLRETDLLERQERFDRAAWRQQHVPDLAPGGLLISLFCYEPPGLGLWLKQLSELPQTVQLSVTAGRATQAVRRALQQQEHHPTLEVTALPYLSHAAFDDMLSAQDLNLVRGEDSLVRAILAGKALLWQIYPQDDGAHIPKLQAFLEATHAPPVVVQAHWAWNAKTPTALPEINSANLQEWTAWAKALQQSLQAQTDLLTRLESFVAAHG